MTLVRSKIETNYRTYRITPGANREFLLVYQLSVINQVALAMANGIESSFVIGAVTKDNGTTVEVVTGGDVKVYTESGMVLIPGDNVYLSTTQAGKVTSVPPTIGVNVSIGEVRQVNGELADLKLLISQPIVL